MLDFNFKFIPNQSIKVQDQQQDITSCKSRDLIILFQLRYFLEDIVNLVNNIPRIAGF